MTDKRAIDRQREAAISMEIGGSEDGEIKGQFPIGGVMHIIKERGIYAIKLADDIDPQRTNPKAPNIQQRLLSVGSESQVVGRTLLTAREMFNEKFLPKSFDHERALAITFDALRDLVGMGEIAQEYVIAEKAAIDRVRNQRGAQGSLIVPSIGDVENRCKAFIQKADHACGALYGLAGLFYKVDVRGCHFLSELCRREYGDDDTFTLFVSDVLPLLGFVRDVRNCFEHPRMDQKCTVVDFSVASNGVITPPAIAAKYRDREYPPAPVSEVMMQLSERLPEIFELMIVHMCEKHVQPLGNVKIEVVEWGEDRRTEKHVRFSYGCRLGDQLAPIS